jgi:alkylation response protein AidB-like acyl-CoA dehydrogenase
MVPGCSLIFEAGNDEQKQRLLPGITEGKLKIALALTEPSARYTPDGVQVKAIKENDGYTVQGTKLFVPDAFASDYLIVVARTGAGAEPRDGINLFLLDSKAAGISCNPLKTIAGDRQYEVIINNVKVPEDNILGEIDKGWPYMEKTIEKAAAASCIDMVGSAQRVLEITVDYAKDRMAFGHPIGAFQSIQHRCADMMVDVESSRYAAYSAAWRINEGLPSGKEISLAKAWINRACSRIVASAHQVHGAIGFTEDHILHFYTKRIKTNQASFGDTDYHLERVAAYI